MTDLTMTAATLDSPRKMRLGKVPMPQPGPDDVLVKVKAIGICSTDLMVYQGRYDAPMPIIPGHESSGVVQQVGANVKEFKQGDSVVVEASWGCNYCASCQQGESLLCKTRVSLGRSRDGTFSEYLTAPFWAVYPLPDGMSFENGQAIISLACSSRAFSRGACVAGEKVAIFGPGIGGLIMAQLAVLGGASDVVMFGTRDWRLQMARDMGSTDVVNVRREDWQSRAQTLTEDLGFDLIFEASGNPEALTQAFQIAKIGGRIVTFSLYNGPVDDFPIPVFYGKEVSLIGSRGGAYQYPTVLGLLKKGRIRLDGLVTNQLPLSQAEEGFALMESREEGVMRVVLIP